MLFRWLKSKTLSPVRRHAASRNRVNRAWLREALEPRLATSGDFAPAVVAGTVDSPALTEASGLVSGRVNPDLFWTHNDSGDTAGVFWLSRTGATKAIYNLSGISAKDWEDIAAGRDAMSKSTICLSLTQATTLWHGRRSRSTGFPSRKYLSVKPRRQRLNLTMRQRFGSCIPAVSITTPKRFCMTR